jgi:GH25 family lysozyme M1 (1,4-beta-N-acetylmuramidase)
VTRLDGPDVSHFQYDRAPIDWLQVAAIPTWWGATKLTQGVGYVDPTANRSRLSMLSVGLTHRGLYHWLSPGPDPVLQAQWFLRNLGELAVGEFVMLDAEESGVTVAKVVAWCEAVEAVIQRPCAVYTGAFVAGIWTAQHVRTSQFGARPMHLAAYTSEAKAKALPGVAAFPWSAWQYSSDGPVAGVTGRCDMNRIDDRAVYDLACGITTPVDPPVVPPKPPVETVPPFVPPTLPNIPIDTEEYTDMAERIIMDKRYNEAIVVGNGAPRWVTGEEFAVAKADGAVVVDAAPHPSFLALAARAGLTSDNLTARG